MENGSRVTETGLTVYCLVEFAYVFIKGLYHATHRFINTHRVFMVMRGRWFIWNGKSHNSDLCYRDKNQTNIPSMWYPFRIEQDRQNQEDTNESTCNREHSVRQLMMYAIWVNMKLHKENFWDMGSTAAGMTLTGMYNHALSCLLQIIPSETCWLIASARTPEAKG